jgi:hypothetical protein
MVRIGKEGNDGDKRIQAGDSIEHSGVYRVVHAGNHAPEHEVTVLYGKRFPARCGQEPRFYPVRLAHDIEGNEHFEKAPR